MCVCVYVRKREGERRAAEADDMHSLHVTLCFCVCISKHERVCMCCVRLLNAYTCSPVRALHGHLREHMCASRTVNTSAYAYRVGGHLHAETLMEACDAKHHQWHLKCNEYFNDPVERWTLGVKLEGNQGACFGGGVTAGEFECRAAIYFVCVFHSSASLDSSSLLKMN